MTARKLLAALLFAAVLVAGAVIAAREVLAAVRTGTWELSDFEDDDAGVFDV